MLPGVVDTVGITAPVVDTVTVGCTVGADVVALSLERSLLQHLFTSTFEVSKSTTSGTQLNPIEANCAQFIELQSPVIVSCICCYRNKAFEQ